MKKTLIGKALLVIATALCAAALFPMLLRGTGNFVFADEIRYFDPPYATAASTPSETIYYTSREEDYISVTNGVPYYTPLSDLDNDCGPTAGAMVTGFYDKYCENLIEGYTSYFPATGKYRSNDSVHIPQLMRDLYTRMHTNEKGEGVTESDCLEGLRSYVQDKGYAIEYEEISSSVYYREWEYMAAIEANTPVLLFYDPAELTLDGLYSDHDVLSFIPIEGNHVYVGFGFFIVHYYNGDDNFRTDTYLRVATGRAINESGLIRINSTAAGAVTYGFNSAYAVKIY